MRVRIRRLHVDGKVTSYWMLSHHRLPPGVAPDGDDEIDESLRRLAEEWKQLRDPLDERDEED